MEISPLTGERGYTIIELVLVIVILGIIGVVAAPRFFGESQYEQRAFLDEVAGALRYAQKVAVASGCPVEVTLAAGSYSLAQQSASSGHCDPTDASFPVTVLLPSGDPVSGAAPSGIAISPATFQYNALGQTNLGSDQTIAVGGSSLTVRADSGLVTVP